MRFSRSLAILAVVLAVFLTACSKSGSDSSGIGEPAASAGQPDASSDMAPASPTSSSGPSAPSDSQPTVEPGAPANPGFPIKAYVELPSHHYVEEMKPLNDREVLVTVREGNTGERLEYRVDMEARTVTVLGEVPDKTGFERASPIGEWTAVWDRETPGIWGVSARTGEKVQWTRGEDDWSPIWRSDGSGFYYLHDTGEDLGDGAGPVHALAYYDIRTGDEKILPFERGYWGRISWLDPDRSILAYNGFDDAIAVKVVNLQDQTEKQILNVYIGEMVDIAEHRAKSRLLVSRNGWFIWYDGKGNEIERVTWPDGLDEYTKKSPRYTKVEDADRPYYELTGGLVRIMPHLFRFSPDGNRLAYLLGVDGESIDDPMPGTRIVVSRDDGREPAFVTPNYARIGRLEWAPSGGRLFVAFNVDDARDRHYVGWVEADPE